MAMNSQMTATSATTTKPTGVGAVKPTVGPAVQQAQESLSFNKEKFQGVKLARLRLTVPDIIQYDPDNPELVLNTTAETGKILPLTPFFQSRLGKTIELVGLVD